MTYSEKKALFEALHVSIAHVGISFDSGKEASEAANLLSALLGKDKKEIPGVSFFVASDIELTNSRVRGKVGHIGFDTDDLIRTLRALEEEGIKPDYQTARLDKDGSLKTVYLKENYFGFGIHFSQRIIKKDLDTQEDCAASVCIKPL